VPAVQGLFQKKDGGPKTVTVNVAAAREIDRLVGNQVRLEKAQGDLPGLAADIEEEDGTAPLGEPDAPLVNQNRPRK